MFQPGATKRKSTSRPLKNEPNTKKIKTNNGAAKASTIPPGPTATIQFVKVHLKIEEHQYYDEAYPTDIKREEDQFHADGMPALVFDVQAPPPPPAQPDPTSPPPPPQAMMRSGSHVPWTFRSPTPPTPVTRKPKKPCHMMDYYSRP